MPSTPSQPKPQDRQILSELKDVDLMNAVRDGSRDAFGVIVGRYWTALVRFSAGILSAGQAEDVVQETFIRVWQRRSEWQPVGSVSAYLFRITRNLALNVERDSTSRDRALIRVSRDSSNVPRAPDPHDDFVTRRMREDVEEAVAALPPRRREVFSLYRFHGLSYKEIGEVMGISVQTVANQMSAALEELREALADWM